ncbi:MAG: hypothetical protein NC113_07875 [Bacteroides sp.]|nr:hypothetical protein [Bacteroides sp.]
MNVTLTIAWSANSPIMAKSEAIPMLDSPMAEIGRAVFQVLPIATGMKKTVRRSHKSE